MFTPKHVGNTDVCEEMFCQRPYSSFFFFFCEDPNGQACLYVYNVYKHIGICMCDVYLCVFVGGGGIRLSVSKLGF